MTLTSALASLDAAEIAVVSRAVAACEELRMERVARAATRLGNGWLYPILSVFIVAMKLDEAVRFIASAAAAAPATTTLPWRACPSPWTTTPAPAATP
jgi:hypothetical protein